MVRTPGARLPHIPLEEQQWRLVHAPPRSKCSLFSMSQWWRIIWVNVSADCLRLERENRSFVIRTGDGASRPRTLSLIAYHNLCIVHLYAFLPMIQRELPRHGVNPRVAPIPATRGSQASAVPGRRGVSTARAASRAVGATVERLGGAPGLHRERASGGNASSQCGMRTRAVDSRRRITPTPTRLQAMDSSRTSTNEPVA